MKNQSPLSIQCAVFVLSVLAMSPPAHAFSLQLLEKQDVSDANYCGDFNKLYTYQLSLSDQDRRLKTEDILSQENLETIEKELRAYFIAPKLAKDLIVIKTGKSALRAFVDADLDGREYCYQLDFSKLFSFSRRQRELSELNPEDVAYFYVAFQFPATNQKSDPAFIVMDRAAEKLYIHQEW